MYSKYTVGLSDNIALATTVIVKKALSLSTSIQADTIQDHGWCNWLIGECLILITYCLSTRLFKCHHSMLQVILMPSHNVTILQLATKKDIGPVACKFYLVSTSPPVRNLEHAPDHHLQKYGCEQKRHALPSAATAYLQHALPCLVSWGLVLSEASGPREALPVWHQLCSEGLICKRTKLGNLSIEISLCHLP